jgi:hypothetical protein
MKGLDRADDGLIVDCLREGGDRVNELGGEGMYMVLHASWRHLTHQHAADRTDRTDYTHVIRASIGLGSRTSVVKL